MTSFVSAGSVSTSASFSSSSTSAARASSSGTSSRRSPSVARGVQIGAHSPPLLGELERPLELLQPTAGVRRLLVVVVDGRVGQALLRFAVGALELVDECREVGHGSRLDEGMRGRLRSGRDLPVLLDREPTGGEVLRRVRYGARACLPVLRCAARSRPALLRRVRHGARGCRAGRRHPPPAREAPTAERRVVSVLFVDLVGFTTASEHRDAEETRELLSSVLRARAHADRPLWRPGREVHRRRRDGGVGHAYCHGGRRRTGGSRGARARGCRARSSIRRCRPGQAFSPARLQ